jgi:uncharacterized protein YigE (DUF2233 family)
MYKHVSNLLHIFLLVTLLGTCGSTVYFISQEPEVTYAASLPTPELRALSPVEATPQPVSPAPQPGWTLLQPGLERREIPVYNGQNEQVETLYVWRLDQNHFRLDVAYDDIPKSLEAWQKETQALMVVNGGFYSIENERYFPDGLAIVNGQASGRSFGYGGMLAIRESKAELRWLEQKPYSSSEPLQAALQSFPILVQPGGVLGFGPERENHASARRTVIGQDKKGRILLMIAPRGYFTLHQLSAFLTESDLGLDIAINLDGGGSTGILVANPPESIPPTRLIPFVILVHPR